METKKETQMIIDLCPFYSEIDLLLLRMHTHIFADKFIVWEFSMDFQGEKKPLHFLNNRELFSEFENRIIYRNYDYLAGNTPQERTRNYRDVILPELKHYPKKTIILNTDTDEIIRGKIFDKYNGKLSALAMSWYVYYMNFYGGLWVNGSICRVKDLHSLYDMRYNWHHGRRKWPTELIQDAGWHFSWLGDMDVIRDKYRNLGHAEGWDKRLTDETFYNQLKEKRIKHWNNGLLTLVPIDETFPEYLLKNQNLYKKYIYEPESTEHYKSVE